MWITGPVDAATLATLARWRDAHVIVQVECSSAGTTVRVLDRRATFAANRGLDTNR